MELATGFDLSSRGQWDDFRVWFFAWSDVCFAGLVYLMVQTQVPPQRGEAHVYLLRFRALFSCRPERYQNGSLLLFLIRILKTRPPTCWCSDWVALCPSSNLVFANLQSFWDAWQPCQSGAGPSFCPHHICRLTHCSDCPPAVVLASRLSTRMNLTHIAFSWSLF